jgi:CBS domain-containing protein
MTVGRILERKGFGLETAPPTTKVAAIASHLSDQGIGSIVIVDDGGNLKGIVSERDIVRALVDKGPSVLEKPVRDIMTQKVITATEEESVAEIMRLMTESKFRHVPITREGKLVGLVSIGDLVKHRISELENETEAFRSYIQAA